MSHDLFNGRFLSRREPAWHALGQVFDEPLTATEALERAKADIAIVTRKIWTEIGGTRIQVPDKIAIVREPTHDDALAEQASPDRDRRRIRMEEAEKWFSKNEQKR